MALLQALSQLLMMVASNPLLLLAYTVTAAVVAHAWRGGLMAFLVLLALGLALTPVATALLVWLAGLIRRRRAG